MHGSAKNNINYNMTAKLLNKRKSDIRNGRPSSPLESQCSDI